MSDTPIANVSCILSRIPLSEHSYIASGKSTAKATLISTSGADSTQVDIIVDLLKKRN